MMKQMVVKVLSRKMTQKQSKEGRLSKVPNIRKLVTMMTKKRD
jgi:hypothetical protein